MRVLKRLGLSADKVADRKNWLGGSDFTRLMSGDDNVVMALWEEKRGEREPEDLSGVLRVQMGSFTEPLNLDWFELQTGRVVVGEQEQCFSTDLDFVRVTLDGRTTAEDGRAATIQAKHVNAFLKIEDVVAKYQPQVQIEMHCAKVSRAILSVFIGTMKYEAVEIEADPAYQADLLMASEHFWECVKSGEPPVAPKIKAPRPEAFRAVDMTGSNEWAAFAADWLDNRAAAKTFDAAAKAVKKLVPDDASTATGHGIEVKRAKNGALSIKEKAEG